MTSRLLEAVQPILQDHSAALGPGQSDEIETPILFETRNETSKLKPAHLPEKQTTDPEPPPGDRLPLSPGGHLPPSPAGATRTRPSGEPPLPARSTTPARAEAPPPGRCEAPSPARSEATSTPARSEAPPPARSEAPVPVRSRSGRVVRFRPQPEFVYF